MQAKGLTKETIKNLGVYERKFPDFSIGDTIIVTQRIQEKEKDKDGKERIKERLQDFEGVVIALHNNGVSTTFTVRKVAHGVAVERIFPFYTPVIIEIKLIRRGSVCRAKLYYIRDRVGKKAKIKEKNTSSARLEV
jgi:large subunit ribosomal protein L19